VKESNRWGWTKLQEIEDLLRHVEFELVSEENNKRVVNLLKVAQQNVQQARLAIKLF
jgi:hypothetical protein